MTSLFEKLLKDQSRPCWDCELEPKNESPSTEISVGGSRFTFTISLSLSCISSSQFGVESLIDYFTLGYRCFGLCGALGGITISAWLWWCIASKNSNYSSFWLRLINLRRKGQFVFFVWHLASSLEVRSSLDFGVSLVRFRFIPYLWQYKVVCSVPSCRTISPLGMQILKPLWLPKERTESINSCLDLNHLFKYNLISCSKNFGS